MAADSAGNDLGAVAIPLTGHVGIAPANTTTPSSAEGAAASLVIAGLRKLGLLTTDGGPDWTTEPSGDPIEFWQDGYVLDSGLATCELAIVLAQTDPLSRELMSGQVPDANGMIDVDASGNSTVYGLFVEEVFKNGKIRRRWCPNAKVKTVKVAKSERGTVNGLEVTFTVNRSATIGNRHFREWMLDPVATVAPTVTGATPADVVEAGTVTLTGTGFIGTTGVTVGGTAATSFSVTSDTSMTFEMPAGAAGSAPIVVTNAAGSSSSFPYTRGL